MDSSKKTRFCRILDGIGPSREARYEVNGAPLTEQAL